MRTSRSGRRRRLPTTLRSRQACDRCRCAPVFAQSCVRGLCPCQVPAAFLLLGALRALRTVIALLTARTQAHLVSCTGRCAVHTSARKGRAAQRARYSGAAVAVEARPFAQDASAAGRTRCGIHAQFTAARPPAATAAARYCGARRSRGARGGRSRSCNAFGYGHAGVASSLLTLCLAAVAGGRAASCAAQYAPTRRATAHRRRWPSTRSYARLRRSVLRSLRSETRTRELNTITATRDSKCAREPASSADAQSRDAFKTSRRHPQPRIRAPHTQHKRARTRDVCAFRPRKTG